MELFMLGMVLACCVIAFSNWRQAIYWAILIDAVRDPMRKLTANQPVWMSQAIVLVWIAIFFACLSQNGRVLTEIKSLFPRLWNGVNYFVAALVPGAILSLVLYRNGWILVVIGVLSYLGPLCGMFIGVCFAERKNDVYRFMEIYIVVNATVLLGSLAEQSGYGWPGLGGLIGFEWIRHMPGVLVRMVSGFFRSPDIAGFHSAHVVVFSILLALPRNRGGTPRPHWFLFGLWGLFTLFLAGRRKMFAIPVVFVIVWLLADYARKQHGSKNLLVFIAIALVVMFGGAFVFVTGDEQLDHHRIYLATAIFDIAPQLYGHAFQGSITTVLQSGVLGSGLGVVTQGAQYAGVDRSSAWQEDGISRLFKELGVAGVICLLIAGYHFTADFRRAFRAHLTDTSRVPLQSAGAAIFVANLACFVISHQHISGDVANGVLPLLFLGSVFGHVLGDWKSSARATQTARELQQRPVKEKPRTDG